jgi:hypothetical protein
MSIKKLFEQARFQKKDNFSDAESQDYVDSYYKEKSRFEPHVDYSKPENFAKFGSAERYYENAVKKVYSNYPYDGSSYEKAQWHGSASFLENYIFEQGYPRTNGFALFSPTGWGSQETTVTGGYGEPSTQEYIFIKGGPNTSTRRFYRDIEDTGGNWKNGYANILALGDSQESNLLMDGERGNTVEFWLKKDAFLNSTSTTQREVVYDMHLSGANSGSTNYARMQITLNGAAGSNSPFLVSYISGTSGIVNQSIGDEITPVSMADGLWHHYAISFKNTGSVIQSRLYIDGVCNHTKNAGTTVDYVSGAMVAAIGALSLYPTENNTPSDRTTGWGWGKISASIDEFRYWKTERTPAQVGRHWFTQVNGGSNTDLESYYGVNLGVYYKFNEGIVGDSTTDSTVLDYSGRISNGSWTGYSADSRNVGSAMVISNAAPREFLDPILYKDHAAVNNYVTNLKNKGKTWDNSNNAALYHSMPQWILDEDSDHNGHLKNLTQIISSYFDTLWLQIEALPTIKNITYTSSSFKPRPHAKKLLQHLGMDVDDIFVDATVLESVHSRNEELEFEDKLYNIKNLIYENIYNNLSYLYKSKGTEKAIRNLVRCFGVDDELVKFNLYAHNVDYELKDNFRASVDKKKYANFYKVGHFNANIHQWTAGSGSNELSYISGMSAADGTSGFANTMQAEVLFPKYLDTTYATSSIYNAITSSLFGVHKTNSTVENNLTWTGAGTHQDNANFQVYAVRKNSGDGDVHFKLVSSDGDFPTLVSDVYRDVYDDERWTLSVTVKPTDYPQVNTMHATTEGPDTYTVVLHGVNVAYDTIQNEFIVSGTMPYTAGATFVSSSKRVYVGAHRTNFTGSVLQQTDAKISSCRYWLDALDKEVVRAHAKDSSNWGSLHPNRNAFLFQDTFDLEVPQIETLALNWDFETVTGSDASGYFTVLDASSGSSEMEYKYGLIGTTAQKQHSGRGYGFDANTNKAVDVNYISIAKQQLPEIMNSSNLTQIVDQNEEKFTRTSREIRHYYMFEKSMYQIISEEMLKMFATIVDFNNIVGEPVNRYRQSYKSMEKLRHLFFERVTNTPDVDKFVEYYKWIDSSLGAILEQFVPASAEHSKGLRNTVESHVLERNKYWTKFPTLEMKQGDPEGSLFGINELLYDWKHGHAPINEEEDDNCLWWKERIERDDGKITSDDDAVDSNKQTILDSLNKLSNNAAAEYASSGTSGITTYDGSTYAIRKFTRPHKFAANVVTQLRGGDNLHPNKKIGFWDSIRQRPAPPGASDGAVIVIEPDNTSIEDLKDCDDNLDLVKGKRKFKFSVETVIDGGDAATGDTYKGDLIYPFSLYSSSISADDAKDYRGAIDSFKSNLDITNIHYDSYEPYKSKPLQGPFTEKYVGGRPYRHVFTNFNPDNEEPDGKDERIEGWVISSSATSLDLVNPNAFRSVYFRDGIAKRPVNIANIQQSTGALDTEDQYIHPIRSTIIGNYTHPYEVVMTTGRTSNNRYFVKSEGDISTTNVGSQTVSGVHDWSLPRRDLTGRNKNIIVNRFSSPGDPITMCEGLLDQVAAEYSVYNALPWRNTVVREPLKEFYTNHTNQFGFYSDNKTVQAYELAGPADQWGTYPGGKSEATSSGYSGTASFHQTHRNSRKELKYTDEYNGAYGTVETSLVHDNWYVQHPIPQTDVQYSWITASIIEGYTGSALYGYEKPDRSHAGGASTDLTFVSSSDHVAYLKPHAGTDYVYYGAARKILPLHVDRTMVEAVDFVGMNSVIYDPITSSDNANTLGFARMTYVPTTPYFGESNYVNPSIVYKTLNWTHKPMTGFAEGRAAVLNAIILHRQGPYGWPSWKQIRGSEHRLVKDMRKTNRISIISEGKIRPRGYDWHSAIKNISTPGDNTDIITTERKLSSFIEPPISSKHRPIVHSMDVMSHGEISRIDLKHSYGNNLIAFSSDTLNNLLDLPVERQQFYDNLTELTTVKKADQSQNPIKGLRTVTATETIFPKQKYTYLAKIRQRVTREQEDSYKKAGSGDLNAENSNFPGYWKSARADRNDARFGAEKNLGWSQGSAIHQGTPAAVSIWALDARLNFETGYSKTEDSTGEAMIGSAVWDDPGALGEGTLQNDHMQFNDTMSDNQLAPVYARRIEEMMADGTRIYAGDTKWEAAEQAGVEPFYNSYSDYIEDIKRVGKDYGLIPEFRISEHMNYYVNQKGGDFLADNTGAFEVPGVMDMTGSVAGRLPMSDRFTVYSSTDFMKLAGLVKEDYQGVLNRSVQSFTLECNGIVKFLPYKGFYPAQRTLDLVKLFWDSYKDNILTEGDDAAISMVSGQALGAVTGAPRDARPLWQCMFAPGILYNTIKSGVAVDYPIYTGDHNVTGTILTPDNGIPRNRGLFDQRVPFESLVEPENPAYLGGVMVADDDPHYSSSFNVTASLVGAGAPNYKMAMHNFLASTVDFFKKDSSLTTIASLPENDPNFGNAVEGTEYVGKLVMSHAQFRTLNQIITIKAAPGLIADEAYYYSASFNYNPSTVTMYKRLGSEARGGPYDSKYGRKMPWQFGSEKRGRANGGTFRNFTTDEDVYGSGFGPPYTPGSLITDLYEAFYAHPSSASYSAYTPPYYDGYSEIKFEFTPTRTEKYSLNDIMNEMTASVRRMGTNLTNAVGDSSAAQCANMQLTASVNYKQMTSVPQVIFDALGNPKEISQAVNSKWVIQPKFETPVLDFSNCNVTLPVSGSGSVARGMWHQYGQVPSSGKGIFLQMQDGDFNEKSLSDLVGFSKAEKRIGEIALSRKMSEAVIAIPFINIGKEEKQFFNISRTTIDLAELYLAEQVGTYNKIVGQQPNMRPSKDIINMVKKMKKYVFPPQFDFSTYKNGEVDPFAMFIFEFEVNLTQEDLSKIWQNLPPDIGRSYVKKNSSLPVDIFKQNNNSGKAIIDIFDSEIQWMVFKVKQKAAWNYFTMTADAKDDKRFKFNFEVGDGGAEKESVPDYNYNWPFDFCSLVELVKLDSTLIMGNPDFAAPPPTLDAAQGTIGPLITWLPSQQGAVGSSVGAAQAAGYLQQITKAFGVLSQQDLEIAQALATAAPDASPANLPPITTNMQQNTQAGIGTLIQTTNQATTNVVAGSAAGAASQAGQFNKGPGGGGTGGGYG